MPTKPTEPSKPSNLTPLEQALLDSFANSLTALDGRLSALEKQSSEDSGSAKQAFQNLLKQLQSLPLLTKELDVLSVRLDGLERTLREDRARNEQLATTYNSAVDAFNSMKAEYMNLASQVSALRSLCEEV